MESAAGTGQNETELRHEAGTSATMFPLIIIISFYKPIYTLVTSFIIFLFGLNIFTLLFHNNTKIVCTIWQFIFYEQFLN